jgi:16S rRNA (guanine527-N7)-methyltransferase
MDSSQLIEAHFPDLTLVQKNQFEQLKSVYEHWNAQINVISRKDLDEFYTRHVLHSLAIAKVMDFLPESHVLDVGTGGGFPGIPLAILFPQTQFHLVDSIGKKIKVVKEVAQELEIKNVKATHARAEQIEGKFDFVVSRAVTAMPAFLPWIDGKIKSKSIHPLKNGLLYLKGGDLTEEMATVKHPTIYYTIPTYFSDPFFETKKVVYLDLSKK